MLKQFYLELPNTFESVVMNQKIEITNELGTVVNLRIDVTH